MDFSVILEWVKSAIAALLKLLGKEVDEDFVGNVESAVKDVVDFGNNAAK